MEKLRLVSVLQNILYWIAQFKHSMTLLDSSTAILQEHLLGLYYSLTTSSEAP